MRSGFWRLAVVAACFGVLTALAGFDGAAGTRRSEQPGAGRKVRAEQPAGRQRRKRAGRRRQRRPNLPPAKIAGAIEAQPVSSPARQSDWPAAAVTADGSLWVAYVQWNDKDADRIVVRRRSPDGTWLQPLYIDDGCWDHYWPAIAARGNGACAVWSGQRDGNFDLYTVTITAEGKVSACRRLTDAPHADFNVRAATDRHGNVTIVWQSLRDGQSDVYLRRLEAAGNWGPELRVSPSSANDWQPSLALDRAGRAWISWDGYQRGNYDVYLRRWDGNQFGPVIDVTTGPRAQFHSSVAVDRQDRVWVAWDEACVNWGKDFSTSSRAPGTEGLHASRRIGLAVYAQGRRWRPTAKLAAVLTGRMSRYAELPTLAFDGSGTAWLLFRHWTIARPTEMYHFYATCLSGDEWATPWRLGSSSGRNSQYPSVAANQDGSLAVVYASDGRSPDNLPKDQAHALHYRVYAAELARRMPGEPAELEPADLPEPPPTRFVRRQRYTATIGDKTYTLLYGDCHRHTDIRGHSGVDASILDTLRYAFDAAQLDFMGFGDHNEVFGGRWPDGLRDYSWWYTQKLIDLHHCPPTFVGLYSYEHSMSRPAGHRNIIFLKRGAPLRHIDRKRPADNQPPLLWDWIREHVLSQPGQKAVIVPHTFAAGPLADWNWPNPPFDCLLEIYQGCRGSYEAWNLPKGEKRGGTQTRLPGHFARDALAKANRYGFVSFSDHRSTHNSFAAVWAASVDRAGVIEAMLARRTFGASDEIILDVTADGHAMGQQFTAPADQPPTIRILAKAPDTILRVDVVKNGEYVYTHRPNQRQFRVEYRDDQAQPGECYYYVRVFQRDPEAPDGDPEIAWASPFFVQYQR